ncbi:MAG: type I-E CRISPR-associated protein Cas6/Cse3/CasE [Thermoplasmata archaeon]|nr:type I-E CRISPR-associated protein Cas6/Cse3/CasE [Thermoplasmata archaeon]
MTHYFSRISATDTGVRDMLARRATGSYGVHKAMWGLFPNDGTKRRDFVYAVLDDGRTIYCVSAEPPVGTDGLWKVETKEYSPRVEEGDILRFRICANPTKANSSTGKHQRHDVVMDLKRRLRESDEEASMDEIVRRAVVPWIQRKGELNGFRPLEPELMIHSYTGHESYKAGVQKISFSTVVIEGLLEVTDSDAFEKALYSGIGTAKGFGCGMLMVKRP